jgi:hypothetical protein
MNPLSIRFIIAGSVILAGGVAIAITGAGVGEQAGLKGTIVILAGLGLIISGWLHRPEISPPPE